MRIELTEQERISLEILLESYVGECEFKQERDPIYYAEEKATAQAILAKIEAGKRSIMREDRLFEGNTSE